MRLVVQRAMRVVPGTVPAECASLSPEEAADETETTSAHRQETRFRNLFVNIVL